MLGAAKGLEEESEHVTGTGFTAQSVIFIDGVAVPTTVVDDTTLTTSMAPVGTELGAKGDFAGCVTGAKNAAAVTAETNKAIADPALQTNGQFGTPTVVANGALVDLNNTGWLKAIIG